MQFPNLNVKYVRRISNNEYSSSCPRCGGERHQNGEYPDRFRIWIKSKTTNGMLGWCRQCGYIWSPQGIENQKEWIQERKVIEESNQQKAQHALELLHREQAWLQYHENLDNEIRGHYHKRNIGNSWIDYWTLGYNPSKYVWDGKEGYQTPALTIPIFHPGESEPVTIRNRLLNPKDPGDKYRPEFGNLPSSLFYADKEHQPKNKALLVEGEFKAMTTYITLADPDIYVVGTPGKTPNPALLDGLNDCEVVYILLDPDAYVRERRDQVTPIEKMVKHFGKRSRVIQLPYKVDDMIINKWLSRETIMQLLKGAIRWTN